MKKLDPQFKIRLPEDLRVELGAKAKAAGRSVTSEIVVRLRDSLDADTPFGKAARQFAEEWSEVEQMLAQYASDVRFAISARAYQRIKRMKNPGEVDEARLQEIIAKYGDPPAPLGLDPDVHISPGGMPRWAEDVEIAVREEGLRQLEASRRTKRITKKRSSSSKR